MATSRNLRAIRACQVDAPAFTDLFQRLNTLRKPRFKFSADSDDIITFSRGKEPFAHMHADENPLILLSLCGAEDDDALAFDSKDGRTKQGNAFQVACILLKAAYAVDRSEIQGLHKAVKAGTFEYKM